MSTLQAMPGGLPRGAWVVLAVLLLAGCVTSSPEPPPRPVSRPAPPEEAFITQRAVLTIRGRQFAMNGYLARSATRGLRLVVTGNLGARVADLLIKPDGRVFVMRSSPLFPHDWIRRHMAADLQCLFAPAPAGLCPVENPEPDLYRLVRRRHQLEVRIVETRPGPQAASLFDETGAETP